MSETRSVTVTRTYDAPIELVYRAWSEAEHIMRWMKCDAAVTMNVVGWEGRAGARFSYRMAKAGEFEANVTGRILTADPPRVFEYATDPDPELGAPELRVRVELEEVAGGTLLTLRHTGLPSLDFCGIVEGGWSVSLELLRGVVETEEQCA